MKKLFFPLFLIVVISLVSFGCKKDKDDEIPDNTEQDIRTSYYSFTISGDFEGEYDFSAANTAGGSVVVVGGYDTDLNEFGLGIVNSVLPNNGTVTLNLNTEMSALTPGNYPLGNEDFGSSDFSFTNDSTTVSFTVDSGSLNITSSEQVQTFFPVTVTGHYINATFVLEMSNEDNETATAQGQIVDGWIIVN